MEDSTIFDDVLRTIQERLPGSLTIKYLER